MEKILNYNFNNKELLIEAFTHTSFMDTYSTGMSYERLELLGDSILDYVANSNLIKFTMFEKYNVQERLTKQYINWEDFQPFDAHQAKSMLTKNNFLAQIMCLYGLQEYILITRGNKDKKEGKEDQESNHSKGEEGEKKDSEKKDQE